MQVYRELRILTARPTPEEEARAPHALYGFVSGSRGLFGRTLCRRCGHGHRRGARAAAACPSSSAAPGSISRCCWKASRRCRPIDPDVRAHWRAQAARRPAPELHADPGAARPGDGGAPDADRSAAHRARAGGAGEHRAVARRLAARARQAGAGARRRRCGCWCCRIAQRTAQTIDARFDAMMAAGALEEVRALVAPRPLGGAADHARAGRGAAGSPPRRRGWRWRRPWPMAKAETRQYAKRQLTWLERNMIAWKAI